MSKLACRCGHTISDTTDRIPYKAEFRPDVHDEDFCASIAEGAQSLVEYVSRGDLDGWLRLQGFGDGYPNDQSISDIFYDFLTSMRLKYSRACYECTACGRLHMESRTSPNSFVSYSPDGGLYEGILQSSASPTPNKSLERTRER
jgi:hypothetical protein